MAFFKKQTFKLFIDIGKQIKTCPDGQVMKPWLRGMDLATLARSLCSPAYSIRLSPAVEPPFSVVQIQHNTHI